jgi:translation initiation factor eIF-2B subunit epsilon
MTVPMASKLGGIETADEILQAVILADSFDRHYAPLTLHRPRCLLPLAGRPLIDYTLQALFAAGIHEIFVAIRSHADLITSYLRDGRYDQSDEDRLGIDKLGEEPQQNQDGNISGSRRSSSQRRQRLNNSKIIPIVMNEDCLSVGDALRELDSHGVIRGHFFLVHGDFVTNAPLRKLLDVHLKNVHNDKNTLLTMIFKTALPEHRCRTVMVDDCAIVYDSHTHQLFHYQTFRRLSSRFSLQTTLLESHSELDVAYHVIDSEVDICSPAVLSLFSENFDYQDIRRDFVHGILTSDLLNYTFYAHILPSHSYALRVSHTQRYDTVSKDLMQRWIFPIVPDANFNESTHYRVKRHCRYVDHRVTLERDTVLGENVIVGRDTRIGARTHIRNAVIGQRCIIGHDVIIEDAYLWDDTIVGDHCKVKHSLLAEHVILKDHVKIARGCILGEEVMVGPDICLPEFTRLVRFREMDATGGYHPSVSAHGQAPSSLGFTIFDSFDEEEQVTKGSLPNRMQNENEVFDVQLVGTQGAGYLYVLGEQEGDDEIREGEASDEEEDEMGDHQAGAGYNLSPSEWYRMHSIGITRNEFTTLSKTEDYVNFSEDELSQDEMMMAVTTTTTSSLDAETSFLDDDVVRFNREVFDTLARAIAANHSLKDTVLEINGLKFAYDITFRDFFRAAIRPLLVAASTPCSTTAATATLSPSSSQQQQQRQGASLFSSSTTPFKPDRAHILAVLSNWSPLLLHFKPTESDQLEMLNEIVTFFVQHSDCQPFFSFVIQVFYRTDVLSEDVLLSWHAKQIAKCQDNPAAQTELLSCLHQVQSFIEWLQKEESDDEEEDVEDDDSP